MSFAAPALRWPDTFATHLPQPLQDSGIPPQYFVIVPATLLAVVLTYVVSQASRVSSAHLVPSPTSDEHGYSTKRSHNKPSTVVLVGLSDTGKTALFSSLVYGTTPATLPSQKMSQGLLAEAVGKPVTVVDLPGHPRLRPLVDEHLSQADGLVICVDAVMASKASTSSTRPGEAETITDVADLLHSTLTTLAKQRARTSSDLAPPSVLILFTRSDLSPLLSGAGVDAGKDEKRRAQLLSRCRTTLESELVQRRANMGLARRRGGNVKIAGLGKVADAESPVAAGGVFGWIKRALGMGGGPGGTVSAEAEEEEEEEDEVVDYTDWAAAQRVDEGSGVGSFSLDKLDDQVVWGGRVQFALASVGKVRSWAQTQSDGEEDEKKTDPSGGLKDLKEWIVDLQN